MQRRTTSRASASRNSRARAFADFRVPADGSYVVKVQDLISSGSAEHYYRLDVDTGPRVAF